MVKKSKNLKKKNKKPNTEIVLETNNNDISTPSTEIVQGMYETELINAINKLEFQLEQEEVNLNSINAFLHQEHDLYSKLKSYAADIQVSIFDCNESFEKKASIIDPSFVFFDFENNQYFDGKIMSMPYTYLSKDKSVRVCSPKGIYSDNTIYSVSGIFMTDKDIINTDYNHIKSFELIVEDILSKYNFENKFSYLCMLPESVDIFNTKIRKCLNTPRGKIISIPKSVALSYYYIENLKIGDKYCVINLDGKRPIITQLSIGSDENGKKIIQREGFIKKTDLKFNIQDFTYQYLTVYSKKYGLSLNEKEIKQIINNKELLLVFDSDKEVSIHRDRDKVVLTLDEDLFKECLKEYSFNIDFEKKKYSHVFISTSLLNPFKKITHYISGSMEAFTGLEKIRDLLCEDKNSIIWKEMLPKITLEVIDDVTGRFKKVDLVDNQSGQKINLSLDEEFEISSPGTITLQKGKKEYYLPLEREIFSDDINSEKEAYFFDKSFPLDENIPVELIVRFNYLSESPLKIYAKPKRKDQRFKELSNSWVDPHTIGIYEGPLYKGHSKDISRISRSNAFENVAQNLRRFVSGESDLSNAKFYINVASEMYHDDLKQIETMYRFVRAFFDSVNHDKTIFNYDYNNLRIDHFYETALEAIQFDFEHSNSTKLNINGYTQKSVTSYKKGLNRILSDMIVSSWYFNKTNQIVLKLYEHLTNSNQIKVLIRLSRCILTGADDIFQVFDLLSYKLNDFLTKLIDSGSSLSPNFYEYVRTLSANCWFSENWINLFYESIEGCNAIQKLIHMITVFLRSNNYTKDKRYRDIMEFLVCITRLKNTDQNILNPNASETKELLRLIKSSYDNAIISIDDEKLVSRLETESSEQGFLFGYPNYIYMLIMTLSGEGQVNLVGYHDD